MVRRNRGWRTAALLAVGLMVASVGDAFGDRLWFQTAGGELYPPCHYIAPRLYRLHICIHGLPPPRGASIPYPPVGPVNPIQPAATDTGAADAAKETPAKTAPADAIPPKMPPADDQ
jgi:hypothetical protein